MVPYEKRKKLDVKAVKMRFIGYDTMAKGYRMLDSSGKIHVRSPFFGKNKYGGKTQNSGKT
jgi:hypothetical protein